MTRDLKGKSDCGRRGLRRMALWFGSTLVLALSSFLHAQAPTASDPLTIERALVGHAREILGDIRKHGYKNVGVLKFQVKSGAGQPSDRIGLINQRLADRLEIALILADNPRAPIGILHDASAVAATLAGANHLEADGRRVLFSGKYSLAWGGSRVTADAFLTGLVDVSKDFQTLTISVLAFDAVENSIRQVTQFQASTDTPALVELGESLLLRGLFDDEPRHRFKPQTRSPLADPSGPVVLEAFYDGIPVPLAFRGNNAELPEPKEGQKLEFTLKARGNGAGQYGCVLKINGESTLFRQREPSANCAKWVVRSDLSPTRIRGYLTSDQGAVEEFRVLSQADSRPTAMQYGKQTGLITLEVFGERKAGPDGRIAAAAPSPPPIGPVDEDVAAISRGCFPEKEPANRYALLAYLRSPPDANRSRGLIVGGDKTKANVQEVDVSFESTPVMFVTIRYHRP